METKPSTWLQIRAVLAGFLIIAILSTAADMVMHASGIYPPPGTRMADHLFIPATLYRIAFGILGSWITARLAPNAPMKHALILGGIGVLVSSGGAMAMWDMGPAWYSLAIIAIALPCAWLGAKIHERLKHEDH